MSLPAYKITYDDGTTNTTSMSKNTTLDDAKEYYIGKTFTDENSKGKETKRKAIKVELVEATLPKLILKNITTGETKPYMGRRDDIDSNGKFVGRKSDVPDGWKLIKESNITRVLSILEGKQPDLGKCPECGKPLSKGIKKEWDGYKKCDNMNCKKYNVGIPLKEDLDEGTSYKVFKNGKFTGTIETNLEYAKKYYKNKETDDVKYKLVPIDDKDLTK